MSLPEPSYVSAGMAEWSGNGWLITRREDGTLDVINLKENRGPNAEVNALLSAIAAAGRYVFPDR